MPLSYIEFAETLGGESRNNIDRYYIDVLNTIISNVSGISSFASLEKNNFLSRNDQDSSYYSIYQKYWIQKYSVERELHRLLLVSDMEDDLQKIVIDRVLGKILSSQVMGDANALIARIVEVVEKRLIDRILLRLSSI
ncbi:unnamed protein product [Mucor circinelloides]